MSTSDVPAAPPIAPLRAPPGRWRTRDAWAGPYGSEPGPRPPLARVAAVGYAAIAVTLLGLGLVALVRGWGKGEWGSIPFLLLLALYSGGLAYGADRLQSKSPKLPASPWVCAPLLLHAACGLLGVSVVLLDVRTFLTGAVSLRSRPYEDFAQGASLLGLLFGWLPAFSPFLLARRGGVLLLAAFAGPIALLAAITLSF